MVYTHACDKLNCVKPNMLKSNKKLSVTLELVRTALIKHKKEPQYYGEHGWLVIPSLFNFLGLKQVTLTRMSLPFELLCIIIKGG